MGAAEPREGVGAGLNPQPLPKEFLAPDLLLEADNKICRRFFLMESVGECRRSYPDLLSVVWDCVKQQAQGQALRWVPAFCGDGDSGTCWDEAACQCESPGRPCWG